MLKHYEGKLQVVTPSDHDCIYTGSSPVQYNNLEHGIHIVRVKSQKCGENDKRLSFKITI